MNDLHKVLMISFLKAEVAKKPSEEETCLIFVVVNLFWRVGCYKEKDLCSVTGFGSALGSRR